MPTTHAPKRSRCADEPPPTHFGCVPSCAAGLPWLHIAGSPAISCLHEHGAALPCTPLQYDPHLPSSGDRSPACSPEKCPAYQLQACSRLMRQDSKLWTPAQVISGALTNGIDRAIDGQVALTLPCMTVLSAPAPGHHEAIITADETGLKPVHACKTTRDVSPCLEGHCMSRLNLHGCRSPCRTMQPLS